MHRLATEYNDPSAQYLVGRNYLKGKSVEKNVQEAIKWFEMAAKQNHIRAQYQLGKIYLYGEGVKANLNYAHYFLNKAAEKNHLDSQYELGNYYLQGTPDKRQYAKAIKWFRHAAARDHVRSLYILGKMTYEGLGTDPDPAEALRLLNLAAENGLLEATHYINRIETTNPEHLTLIKNLDENRNADLSKVLDSSTSRETDKSPNDYYRLGLSYLTGDDEEVQLEKSAQYFQKAADKHHAKAQYQLAKLYKQGIGVKQNESLYRKWLGKAASAGVQSAVRELDSLQPQEKTQLKKANPAEPSLSYARGLNYLTGNGVAKDPVKAAQLFMDAAMRNHPKSQYQLGIMYVDGIGLSRDTEQAKQWLEKAASAGLVDARTVLDSLAPKKQKTKVLPITLAIKQPESDKDTNGQLFYPKDSPNSSLIDKAKQGDTTAQYRLGMNYLKGQEGFQRDIGLAVVWLEKAANNGEVKSQYQLGSLFQKGLGVEKSNSTAIMWYRKAANQGHREARKRLGGCRIC
ncbi:tetratricopeptide repeat protein [Kaarinaea lacus]